MNKHVHMLLKNPHHTHDLYLFPLGYSAAGNDNNLVFFVKGHNLSNTVGGTRVVDIAEKEKTE